MGSQGSPGLESEGNLVLPELGVSAFGIHSIPAARKLSTYCRAWRVHSSEAGHRGSFMLFLRGWGHSLLNTPRQAPWYNHPISAHCHRRKPMTAQQPDSVRIALVQMRCEPDPESNLRRAIVRIREAAAAGGQVVCLQELFLSHYFC